MRPIAAIAKREIHSFFVSAIAYVVLTVWLLVQGLSLYLFAMYFADQQNAPGAVTQTPLTLFFGGSVFFYIGLLVVVPLLTMRLVADEKRTGTLEPLLTAPITEWQLVLGKYLAAMVFWVVLGLPTLFYVLILNNYGHIDLGVVAASYLGVFGVGLYYMALGLLMSTIAPNQIVAAVLAFFVVMFLFTLGVFEGFVDDPAITDLLGYVSVWGHMEDFAKGIVDSRYLAFEATTAALALFVAVRVLEARRYEE
jgi:ABC-2 type transport system permease protein